MNRKYFYFAILFLIIVGLIYTGLLKKGEEKSDLNILQSDLILEEDASQSIEATLKNNAEHTYTDVHMTIQLLNAENELIGSTTASTDSIRSGEEWKVKVAVVGDSIADFKIISIETAEEVIRKF